MRAAFILFGVLLALLPAAANADGLAGPYTCYFAVACYVPVKVGSPGAGCTSTPPSPINVKRRIDGLPTLLIFYPVSFDPKWDFDNQYGVTIKDSLGGTPWKNHFTIVGRQYRQFKVVDSNPSDDDFPYEVRVTYDGMPCIGLDPLIHNTF